MMLPSAQAEEYIQVCRLIDLAVDRYLLKQYREDKEAGWLLVPTEPKMSYKRYQRMYNSELPTDRPKKPRKPSPTPSIFSLLQPVPLDSYRGLLSRKRQKPRIPSSLD